MSVPTLGVLGGMGPAATADFLAKLAQRTPAVRDQDHLRTVVYSDPVTPDRSDAILGQGEDPLPAMITGIEFLERSGVDLIAIPCNSAHYWYDQLQAATSIPIVHIVEAVNAQITRDEPDVNTVGLLATTGTVASGIYGEVLGRLGRTVVSLDAQGQQQSVMGGIRAVKAGEMRVAKELLTGAIGDLVEIGAQGVVYGCTDVSAGLDLPPQGVAVRAWDSADALAVASVDRLLKDRRAERVANVG